MSKNNEKAKDKMKEENITKEEQKDNQKEAEKQEENKDSVKDERPEETKGETEEESWNNKYLRLMADFQNYKRRSESEKSDIYARANERIISELLNVIDNFDRALESAKDDTDKHFVEGVEMILKQFMSILESEGVEEIKALGEDFDPNYHSAVMTAPSDEYKEGKVSEVLQKGYTLKGKVIRPSTVKVVG